VALLLAGSVSHDRIAAPGVEKYFCELDCHLAYTVTAVERLADAGESDYRVSLRTRFDATTISPRRGTAAPTWPGPRRVAIVGSDGARYAATEMPGPASTPLQQELRPGESYVTELRSSLPVGVTPVSLDLEDDIPVNILLIGNERSPGHGRTLLAMPAVTGS